jgi:hypothetical protein
MEARLRAGVALYNAGRYLAAHEPLESLWLEAPAGERDDCLQGLLQASVAAHKSREGNESGAVGLAESAREYLASCGDRSVAVDALEPWLDRLREDPTLARREEPPTIRLEGTAVRVTDLGPEAAIHAVEAVAETDADDLLGAAAAYAAADLEDRGDNRFLTLAAEYVETGESIVRQRLGEHVERRRMRESDVAGLF